MCLNSDFPYEADKLFVSKYIIIKTIGNPMGESISHCKPWVSTENGAKPSLSVRFPCGQSGLKGIVGLFRYLLSWSDSASMLTT